MYFNKIIPELSVTNIKNSLKFYQTIGFKIEYERPENKFVFLSMGEIQFMLQEITSNDKWNIAPLVYPFGNGINFQLEVDNLDKIYNNNFLRLFGEKPKEVNCGLIVSEYQKLKRVYKLDELEMANINQIVKDLSK